MSSGILARKRKIWVLLPTSGSRTSVRDRHSRGLTYLPLFATQPCSRLQTRLTKSSRFWRRCRLWGPKRIWPNLAVSAQDVWHLLLCATTDTYQRTDYRSDVTTILMFEPSLYLLSCAIFRLDDKASYGSYQRLKRWDPNSWPILGDSNGALVYREVRLEVSAKQVNKTLFSTSCTNNFHV
jgi:hypothetical protein